MNLKKNLCIQLEQNGGINMSKVTKSKLQKQFEKLVGIFFSTEKFGELATHLLLGRIGMRIYKIESNYDHYIGKRGTNPLMYWEIGREIVEFARRRIKDHKKFLNKSHKISREKIITEVEGFLSEMANQSKENKKEIEEINGSTGDLVKDKEEEEKIKFHAVDFSSRSLRRCGRFYDLIKNNDRIDPEIPWSIYAAFADQYATIKDFSDSNSKFVLLDEIIELRNELGRDFSDKIARIYIYEFDRMEKNTSDIKGNLEKIEKMIKKNIKNIKSSKTAKTWYKNKYNPIKFD